MHVCLVFLGRSLKFFEVLRASIALMVFFSKSWSHFMIGYAPLVPSELSRYLQHLPVQIDICKSGAMPNQHSPVEIR